MEKVKIGEYVGEYFIKNRNRKELIIHAEVATQITNHRSVYDLLSRPVTTEQLHHAISKAREYLEINYRLTIWNDRGYGLKAMSLPLVPLDVFVRWRRGWRR